MKKVKLINFNNIKQRSKFECTLELLLNNKGKYFVNISPENKLNHLEILTNKKAQTYLLVNENNEILGVLYGEKNELTTFMFRNGYDKEYIINELVKLMVLKANKRDFIKIFIYAGTAYTKLLEKLGFIKRKVFYDKDDHKYFKMFKII